MSNEITEMMHNIEKLKKIDEKELIMAFERGITSAAKKVYGIKPVIRVEMKDGGIKFFWTKKVTENSKDEFTEIGLYDAKKIDAGAQVGQDIEVEFNPTEFGRIAAQTTKQVITQRIREIEKEQIYNDYKDKEGEVVTGIVHNTEHGDYIVDLGVAQGILKEREQVPKETYKIGEHIRAIIIKVNKSKGGAVLELSRTHPNFIKKIFALEVTEVDQNIVEIKYIAREPGVKTKVVVTSNDPHVDPVGACIGVKGSRIQTIISEIHGEKVDVVLYSDDIKKYLESAIAPIKIKNLYIDEVNKYAVIAVPDDQFSQVIGKNGVNMRLVAKITKWKVSVLRESEYGEERLEIMKAALNEQIEFDLFKLSEDIPVKTLIELKKHAIKNLKDFALAEESVLAELLGKPPEEIKLLREKAANLMEHIEGGKAE